MVINDDINPIEKKKLHRALRVPAFNIFSYGRQDSQQLISIQRGGSSRLCGEKKYHSTGLLKCLRACIIHSAVSLSYEHITAIKWDCGLVHLHCLSPSRPGMWFHFEFSWMQTCQNFNEGIISRHRKRSNPFTTSSNIYSSSRGLLKNLPHIFLSAKQQNFSVIFPEDI